MPYSRRVGGMILFEARTSDRRFFYHFVRLSPSKEYVRLFSVYEISPCYPNVLPVSFTLVPLRRVWMVTHRRSRGVRSMALP